MVEALIVIASIVAYGLMAVFTGVSHLAISARRQGRTNIYGSKDTLENDGAVVLGLLWPIGIWLVVGERVIMALDKREDARRAAEAKARCLAAEREKFLEAARKELPGFAELARGMGQEDLLR